MAHVIDEAILKIPLQEQHPYEDSVVESEAFGINKRRRFWGTDKALSLFGITLSLFNCGSRRPSAFVTMDQSDRKRFIDTGSQSLSAQFDLLDVLSIKSTSGSVNVGIHPQPADKSNPVSAEVLVSSQSGSIGVNFAALNVPDRDYHVSVESQSGTIEGNILHGRETSVVTGSSQIKVYLTPYGVGDYSSTLATSTSSGSQRITLLSPIGHPGASLKEMKSTHSSTSGSVVLRYPREWEGTIEGYTESGGLQLHGGNLEIIRQSQHDVIAKKGNGNSTLSVQTASGGVDIYFE